MWLRHLQFLPRPFSAQIMPEAPCWHRGPEPTAAISMSYTGDPIAGRENHSRPIPVTCFHRRMRGSAKLTLKIRN